MQKNTIDFGKIYGYTVCLVAILAFMYGSVRVTGGMLDLREPPYTKIYRNGPSLVSVGSYRMDLLGQLGCPGAESPTAVGLPADSSFQRMYEAERMYRLALSHQVTRRKIVVNVVLQVLAVLLFAAHWAWLRRRERPSTPAPG